MHTLFRALCCCAILGILSPPLEAAKKLTVRVIDKVDNETSYRYVVPGYTSTTTNANASCFDGTATVSCTGSSTSTTSSAPSTVRGYDVRGATLSLQLPDGRVAVVNCDSKANWTGLATPRRGCRIPAVNSAIEAEFNGDNVKLRWRIGIDGEKGLEETYKLVALLDKR